jgi:hypothetical protein
MVSIPVSLANGRRFKTQGEALRHFQDLRDRYADEERITAPADHDDLVALLERFDALILDGPPKSAPDVDHFFRRLNRGVRNGVHFATPGFWVMRTDGTSTDFSFPDAVKGRPKGGAREIYDACRDAVAEDMRQAKDDHFALHADAEGRLACEFSDILLTRDEARLNYAAPHFIEIVTAFRAANGWEDSPPDGTVTASADQQTTARFADPAVAQAFAKFHHERANLRIVTKSDPMPLPGRRSDSSIRLVVALPRP